jgi:hypothetical protein
MDLKEDRERESERYFLNFAVFVALLGKFGGWVAFSIILSHLALFLLYSYLSFSTILAILLMLL